MTTTHKEENTQTTHYIVLFFCKNSYPGFLANKLSDYFLGDAFQCMTTNESRTRSFVEYSYEFLTKKSHVDFLECIAKFSDNDDSVYCTRVFQTTAEDIYEKDRNSIGKFKSIS